ncbi:MAG TPA: hypothetical protein VFD58_15740 [Blastocatellia bacterium]|nr:hypothetical protein [Blastocatellia bacterium]
MSGRRVSVIVTYGVDENGQLILRRQLVFPSLRTIPNDTHASLLYFFGDDATPRIFINGLPPRNEVITSVHHRGLMTINSVIGRGKEVSLARTIFPSTDKQLLIEKYTFTNTSGKDVRVEIEDTEKVVRANPSRGVYGAYLISAYTVDKDVRTIRPGESAAFAVAFTARKSDEKKLVFNVEAEEKARKDLVAGFLSKLQLETPDTILNTAFAFAKIRTTESVYETRGGLMHGPGGGRYYAAIWANDQAEYANPFFPFLGDRAANESAINSFRLFAGYMNPDYKPIPSSIIAEGTSDWHGAGDRGDMAMIAYGATRFALAYGSREAAEELWPLIEWCLEYCHRKVNDQGVVASDSDELERRFPAGKANLNTSSLYYDALNSAGMLGKELGKPEPLLSRYAEWAKNIRAAIEKHFGASVEGFNTYRYYDGNTVLRSWICTPLTVGIYDRKDETIRALFSPRLWTPDGLATQAGDKTFWDRSTLYGLRGALAAGETQKAMEFLTCYSGRRLLGDHVPYPVEAYPEGNQRHLAAESALYCRIFTEGLFGIRPTGLSSFLCIPRLPKEWDGMKLKNIQAFGNEFDLTVARSGGGLKVEIIRAGKTLKSWAIKEGDSVSVDLGRQDRG